jgi:hypothetical protein
MCGCLRSGRPELRQKQPEGFSVRVIERWGQAHSGLTGEALQCGN